MLGIAYLIKGDGEEAVIDVINTIKGDGNIAHSKCISYYGKQTVNIIEDLDALPFPYRPTGDKNMFSLRSTTFFEKTKANDGNDSFQRMSICM